MNLFRKINSLVEGVITPSPYISKHWNIAILPLNGVLLSCDNFSLKLNERNFNSFIELLHDKKSGEIRDSRLDLVFIEPDSGGVIITRQNDRIFPSGIFISKNEIKNIIQFVKKETTEELPEGVKLAYRRSGKKIKRGFRVTSGFRKGRVVANIQTAYKPKAKASVRAKMRLAAKKKRVVRVMKSRITRKKSLYKRVVRLNRNR